MHQWISKSMFHDSTKVGWDECHVCEAIKGAPNQPTECSGESIWPPIRNLERRKCITRLQHQIVAMSKEIQRLETEMEPTRLKANETK